MLKTLLYNFVNYKRYLINPIESLHLESFIKKNYKINEMNQNNLFYNNITT